MTQTFVIRAILPTMNEIIADCKSHYARYSKPKKEYDAIVAAYAKQQLKPVKKQVDIYVIWYCRDKRKDKDGISAGIKFILDGLVKAKIIPDDNWKWIGDIHHTFAVDKKQPRIEVVLDGN